MEQISNRALAVLLVAAIIISLTGSIVVLNKIGPTPQYITAAATTDEGFVNLSVAGGISITTEDSERINFGACTPNGSFNNINSEDTEDEGICSTFTGPVNITVRNNGNVNVNVSMTPTDVGDGNGGSFLTAPSDTAYIAYKAFDGWASNQAHGCYNNTITGINSSSWNEYTNLTTAGTPVIICGNLTYGTSNSVGVYVRIGVPADAVEGHDNVTFAFLGENTG